MLPDAIDTTLTPTPIDIGRGPVTLGAMALFVETGALDIYLADPRRAGSHRHVLSVPAGEAVFPIAASSDFTLLGFPATGETRLRSLDLTALGQVLDAGDGRAIDLVEAHVERVARAFAATTTGRTIDLTEQLGGLPKDVPARPNRGLLWLTVEEGLVRPDLAPEAALQPGALALPIAAASPSGATAVGEMARVTCRTSQALAATGGLSEAFRSYGNRITAAIEGLMRTEAVEAAEQIAEAPEQMRLLTIKPFLGLISRDRRAAVADPKDPLASAFREVAAASGVALEDEVFDHCPPPNAPTAERLSAFAHAAKMRLRPVKLTAGWWRNGGQHLIVFDREAGTPLAALARTGWRHGYDLVAPDGKPWTARHGAARCSEYGYVVQRPLPAEPINGYGLLRFSARLATPLAIPALTIALVIGLLGLITPIGTEILFETVIPASSHSMLLQLVAGLAGLGLGATAFELVRNFLLLRMATLVNADLEGAMWDRLLRLPAVFFRRYAAGDLALRAGAVNQMRDTIGGAVMNTLLSSVFSIASFGLLLYYAWKLALVALVLVCVQIVVTVVASVMMMSLNRQALATEGRLQSLSLQTIIAIGKLKVAGAEARAFTRWAPLFLARRDIDFRKRRLSTIVDAFGATLGVLSMALLIWMVGFGGVEIGIAQFVAFNAAFGQFLSAALSLAGVVPAMLGLIPLYERAKPLLQTLPEDEGHTVDPGVLRGDVELNNVVFRYAADGPTALNGVSLRARPGEFIAIVGPSGAGKSSLLRLLLGFERPESGSVFFDQQEASSVDMRMVRKQMGVVLQNGHAATGSILENILGGSTLGEDDAWEAARLAGLDEDIRQMPMKMHTFAGENGMLLSGGQRQRLLIARAVVRRPRLILFDEATSALDNRSQQIVSERLAHLEATRIVIAHRLSTVAAADRIYVLDAGRVVEEGNYDELMRKDGVFAALARRQTA
ncbi:MULTISPECIES: NHLP bacteriocin export ABC transporter permease/ATPase subunit [unclassified Chelatococcus]|uniref:NHLP bacteriocin export ABC transporter permease/ATPase subunit n=1 Tax=unclassified Chelatococcus TaxID=2638111 RepID=UPI001BCCA556|nr:NHLP bacteriocin export ABC transporter permease/ATPase subunit [Chelatococcus sp.]MBS7742591.1 NHLP bacteriocin export ABC transporter permease/ATPase subunit [Chelatococcus sp. HY11]CAH1655568.1 NHLP bacteriocin export ABC transporter permease/ATPase subunit [Hyphomicrobiales bacterium]MBX3542291.1 NHLP bacteriocin export ABC transporter permease/ATPase subunit [Chelatococcus sp.]MCO5075491.1 NHLP bacteriocin export ABC transporter permease/ATPase subunit [Chelatococcus sp.]CAH1695547.1 N